MSHEQKAVRPVWVEKPWGWCWVQSDDFIRQDPDITDRRRPRSISTLDVNWADILFTVRHAVRSAEKQALDRGGIYSADVQVTVPMPLTAVEHHIVAGWLGSATPVTCSYEEGIVEDGRHRLWLTRDFTGGVPVPARSSNLWYLHDSLSRELQDELMIGPLDEARSWWDNQDSPGMFDDNAIHRRFLSLAYLASTDPSPLPAAWTRHFALSEDHLLQALGELHERGRLGRTEAVQTVPWAWRFCPDGKGILAPEALALFRFLAGKAPFTIMGEPTPPPRHPLRLFRGATSSNRTGVSWTANPEIAAHFAHNRQATGQVGTLWTAHVPPDRVLAYFPDEQEFIVDLTDREHLVQAAQPGATPDWITRRQVTRLDRLSRRRARSISRPQ